ncbi:MAG: flagellar export chaperone FliS [Proteobacteria bacterium]|nr:flagellar export chaperone FliS [Pseudomonadota bacterium]
MSATARAATAYRRVDLESAPKTLIIERLYERFVRDVDDAKRAITDRDILTKARMIDHAMAIVVELEAALDHGAAPELCKNLKALYRFVAAKLTEANATLAVPALDQAARVMTELGDAFRQAHANLVHP